MLSTITDKLRALAHQSLTGSESVAPLIRRVCDVASTVNDMLG